MKPRTGAAAVTTMMVSPASGSTSRCRRPALVKRHGDVGQRGIADVAHRHQRLGRGPHRIGKHQRPVDAAVLIVAGQRRHLGPVETNADRLPLVQRQQADVGDDERHPGCGSARHRSALWNRTPAKRYRRGETTPPASATAKENFRVRPSLLRLASTAVALSLFLISGGGSAAASVVFAGASATAAGASFGGDGSIGASAAGIGFGAGTGSISPDCRGAAGSAAGCSAGFSGADGAGCQSPDAAGAGAGGASAADGDGTAGFSACWNATSTM